MEKEVRFQKLKLSYEQKKKMKKPIIRNHGPYSIKGLIEGKKYVYCTCGLSAKDPFCDGSHKGTKFKKIKFRATADKIHLLCGCKQNKGKKNVYCDGTHNQCSAIPIEEVF